jgi:hypothetical protein
MMERSQLVNVKKSTGDTAVDGLMAGLAGGLAMALFSALAGLLDDRQPLVTLGYFDPARAGNWLTGLLAHLAVSAIYGAILGLLVKAAGWIRPSLLRLRWLLGIGYGLLLYSLAHGVIFTAIPSPLYQISAWQLGAAHLFYGLVLSLRLLKNQ